MLCCAVLCYDVLWGNCEAPVCLRQTSIPSRDAGVGAGAVDLADAAAPCVGAAWRWASLAGVNLDNVLINQLLI